MRSREDCMPIIWLCITWGQYKLGTGRLMRIAYEILALEAGEASRVVLDSRGAGGLDILDARPGHLGRIFLLWLFEHTGEAAQLAAAAGSLGFGERGPGRTGGAGHGGPL